MQRLEVSGAVGPIYGSLGVKRLIMCVTSFNMTSARFVLFCGVRFQRGKS